MGVRPDTFRTFEIPGPRRAMPGRLPGSARPPPLAPPGNARLEPPEPRKQLPNGARSPTSDRSTCPTRYLTNRAGTAPPSWSRRCVTALDAASSRAAVKSVRSRYFIRHPPSHRQATDSSRPSHARGCRECGGWGQTRNGPQLFGKKRFRKKDLHGVRCPVSRAQSPEDRPTLQARGPIPRREATNASAGALGLR